jgi:hypothetical protein
MFYTIFIKRLWQSEKSTISEFRYPALKFPVIFWNAPGRIRRKQIYEKESLTAPIA